MEEEVEVVGEEMVVEVEVEVEEVVQGRQTWFRSAELCCLLCIC